MAIETLIDPFNETIDVVEANTEGFDYKGYCDLIEAPILTFVRLYKNGDGVYLDDEGLYREKQFFWIHKNYPMPLCGKAVLIGTEEDGETYVPKTSVRQLKKDIHFIGSRYHLSLHLKISSESIKVDKDGNDIDYRPVFFHEVEKNKYSKFI